MSGLIPFVVGLAGILLFVGVRFFENKRGARFFGPLRESLDASTVRIYRALVLGDIPRSYRKHVLHALRRAVHSFVVFLATLLRRIERMLSRAGHSLRPTRAERSQDRNPSQFLKTITPEKKGDGTPSSDSVKS